MLIGQSLTRCTRLLRNPILLCNSSYRQQLYHRKSPPVARPQHDPRDEYVDVPQYPEILDLSLRSRKKRDVEAWHETIRKLPTVEEKAIKINMPRYYGYRVFSLSEKDLPYNCLSVMQHFTRTVFEEIPPTLTSAAPIDVDHQGSSGNLPHLESIHNDMKNALEFAYDSFICKYPEKNEMEPSDYERLFTQMIVEQIHRVLMNALVGDYPHLQRMEVDYNPHHEAFWSVGGFDPPQQVAKLREKIEGLKEIAHDSIDQLLQYNSVPYLALRHPLQLSPWRDFPTDRNTEEKSNNNSKESLPKYNLDPRSFGFSKDYKHVTCIPGYWPNNQSAGFGYLSYQMRNALHKYPIENYGPEHYIESLHCHAIQSSYAWLLAQAHHNGFTTYNEITYPMNTQTIITDGQNWSFYEYQLNTLLLNGDHIEMNPRVNYCRGTKSQQLYEGFNERGQLLNGDLNTDVLQQLIKCYTQVPNIERPLEELRPYLDLEVMYSANYDNDEKSEFLHKIHRHLAANRPRHLEVPEIYMWERIYKINHKTRPMEPRRRFFELFINPWRRRLDEHQKEYIPKAVRPDGPKSPKKWKNTYYP